MDIFFSEVTDSLEQQDKAQEEDIESNVKSKTIKFPLRF